MSSPKLKHEMYGPAIVLIFIISRIIFFLNGGSFLATPITFAKQYLDPALLQNDLLRSLFYLHSQPPLFNFFLGSILKLSPMPAITYNFIFKIVGLLIPLIFYGIFTRIGINRFVALVATIIFMLNPTLILYENLLYYTHFEAFLILLAIFFFVNWCNGGRLTYLLLFWVSLLCLGMIRSLFHPAFFLIMAIAGYLCLRRTYKEKRLARKFLLTSFIVLIPMFSLCMKNFCLYDFFGTSSWTGMSLWIKVNGYAPQQIEEFHGRGLISQEAVNAGLETFQPIRNLIGEDKLNNIPCHHPADCNEFKNSDKPNYNHAGYVFLSKQLLKDALALISYNPALSAFYTAGSYSLMLWYSSDSVIALFINNIKAVDTLERLYRYLYFGFMGVEDKRSTQSMWWMRANAISAFFLLFYLSTFFNLFRRDNTIPPALLTVCFFCLIIHAYTIVISSLIEFGENNRFRYPVDAAFLVLAAGNIVIWGNSLKAYFRKK